MNWGKSDNDENLRKQIIYPKFIPRIFASLIDMLIISIIMPPISFYISKYLFLYIFSDFFVINNIDISDQQAVYTIVRSVEFREYITISKVISYFSLNVFFLTCLISFYCIGFWKKFGATPGKMLLRFKIVTIKDYKSPSIWQLVKRFLGYISIILSIIPMIFSKNKQALHDKFADTILIKK